MQVNLSLRGFKGLIARARVKMEGRHAVADALARELCEKAARQEALELFNLHVEPAEGLRALQERKMLDQLAKRTDAESERKARSSRM